MRLSFKASKTLSGIETSQGGIFLQIALGSFKASKTLSGIETYPSD